MDLNQLKKAIDSLDYPDIVALRDFLDEQVVKKHDDHVRQVREKVFSQIAQAGLKPEDVLTSKPVTASGKARKLPILYADPDNPKNVWSGRGKTPAWLQKKVDEGASIEDFRVAGT